MRPLLTVRLHMSRQQVALGTRVVTVVAHELLLGRHAALRVRWSGMRCARSL